MRNSKRRDQNVNDNRAAQYVRMSTDHQHYSIDNQIDAIREFADAKGLKLVRTYSDPGRSGLTLKNRPGLQRLLSDVADGGAPFSKLLVYDVSRWGRFQEPDEGAAYEHQCRSRGVEVIYCVESFDNSGGMVNSLMKHMKRTMAAEYSRDLSMRISRAKTKLAEMGHFQGTRTPFGFERWAVSRDGRRIKLEPGKAKHSLSWHTVLEPGPSEEVACVRRIFRLFVSHGRSQTEIAETLNAEGWRTKNGGPWSVSTIHYLLRSEVYIGTAVYGKSSAPLGGERVKHEEHDWLRVPNAFPGIISQATFAKARKRLESKRPLASDMTDEEMLAPLRAALKKHGYLSADMIANNLKWPGHDGYRQRFGSVGVAFGEAGYRPDHFQAGLEDRRNRGVLRAQIAGQLRLGLEDAALATSSLGPSRFEVNGKVVTTLVATPHERDRLSLYWYVKFPRSPFDIGVAARLDFGGASVSDYTVILRPEISGTRVGVGPKARSTPHTMATPSIEGAIEHLLALVVA